MKKTLAALACAAFCGAALATPPTGPRSSENLAVAVGVGVANAAANSSATGGAATSTAAGGAGGAATATGGAGGAADAKGGTATATVTTPKQVGSIGMASPPQVINSCRHWLSIMGANKDGSGGGILPLWNDRTCTVGALKSAMVTTNQQYPGTYTVDDFLRVDCLLDNASELDACKRLAERDRKRTS